MSKLQTELIIALHARINQEIALAMEFAEAAAGNNPNWTPFLRRSFLKRLNEIKRLSRELGAASNTVSDSVAVIANIAHSPDGL